jgi:peroxiredoxin
MSDPATDSVEGILDRVRQHDFHPVDERNFTLDRGLGTEGIADLSDLDWRIRLLAVRDLVRRCSGDGDTSESRGEVRRALCDTDPHVRYVCAKVCGIVGDEGAIEALERIVRTDPDGPVRSQAVLSLGQLVADESVGLLETVVEDDDRDVSHRARIALDRIAKGAGTTNVRLKAYRRLDPGTFGRVSTGDAAPEFRLSDTEGTVWDRSALAEADEWLVLVWVFADWCPVCHGEFDELLELRAAFDDAGVSVATVECHDRYRGRVMVGTELESTHWLVDDAGRDTPARDRWWPHLLDHAGAVGATVGVDPLAFAVHAEYINRPATIVIDPNDTVRFAYVGTFWGDRPTVGETLEMIRSGEFAFEHPDRRRAGSEDTR